MKALISLIIFFNIITGHILAVPLSSCEVDYQHCVSRCDIKHPRSEHNLERCESRCDVHFKQCRGRPPVIVEERPPVVVTPPVIIEPWWRRPHHFYHHHHWWP